MCDERKSPTSCDGEDWWGSNYGPEVDLAAPGVEIYTTDLSGTDGYVSGNYMSYFSGTSAACPNTAGVAALLLSYNPNFTQQQVFDILKSSADEVGNYTYTNGRCNDLGYGRVNAHRAIFDAADDMMTISGPSVVCTSDVTFELNNAIDTITWTKSNNLAYVSGQGTNEYEVEAINSNVSGNGWVQAEIRSGALQPIVIRKNFWVGPPYVDEMIFTNGIEEEGFFCTSHTGNEVEYPFPHSFNYFDIKVSNISGTQVLYSKREYYSNTSTELDYSALSPDYYLVGVQGNNSCGTGTWNDTEVEWMDCLFMEGMYYLNLAPNPVTTEIEIEIMQYDGEPIDDNITWDVEVFDFSMNLKSKSNKIYSNKHKVSTHSWKEGIYVIRAFIDNEIITKKFIKE